MDPVEVAREAFKQAWRDIWGQAAMLIVAILVLLGFMAIVWLYLEYKTIRPRYHY